MPDSWVIYDSDAIKISFFLLFQNSRRLNLTLGINLV